MQYRSSGEVDGRQKNGLLTSRMRHITIRQRSSRLVELQPVLAEQSVTRLSGRTYVYQAMRVTGAADPTVSVKDTLKGKASTEETGSRSSTRIQLLW